MVKKTETKTASKAKKVMKPKKIKKTETIAKSTPEQREIHLKEFQKFIMMHKKSISALIVLAIGILFNLYWLIGLLMICWGLNDFVRGETYLFETVTNKKTPYLYWIILIVWVVLGLGLIIFPPVFF